VAGQRIAEHGQGNPARVSAVFACTEVGKIDNRSAQRGQLHLREEPRPVGDVGEWTIAHPLCSGSDSSVLPRSSRANPALSVYAWGLRLGAHLSAKVLAPPGRATTMAAP